MAQVKPQVIDDEQHERVYERVAAVDVAKDSGMVCTRTPHPSRPGARQSTVWTVKARMAVIRALGRQLKADGIEMVTLEATSDYWRIWFYVLEAAGLAVQLVNAAQARNLPGRPKTDKLDAMWLARLTEMGLLRPSFVPPAPIRALRDYTRARTRLVQERTRCFQRLEKLLEGALIKLSSVASKLTTESAKDMIRAMIAGERDPHALAALARTRMKAKHDDLVEALAGMFDDHHGELAQLLLDQAAFCDTRIAQLTARITAAVAAIPAAWGVDADGTTGPDAGTGPDAAALPAVPAAGGDPRHQPRPGLLDHRGDRPGYGQVPDRRPPGVMGRAVPAGPPVRTPHPQRQEEPGRQLAARHARPGRHRRRPHRHLPRRTLRADRPPPRQGQSPGRGRPLHPGHHLAPAQSDPGARFADLGYGYYQTRTDTDRKIRNHIRQIQALGFEVTITKAT